MKIKANLNDYPQDSTNRGIYINYVKKFLDLLFSTLGLVILFPIFLILALMIKLDSKGPVFFLQERLGKNGEVFKIIKFRTMVVNAEKLGTGLFIEDKEDNRITRIGKFLRKTSLDEFPQLINILKGDMSFVGPRPPVTYFPYDGYENYPEWARGRFGALPGITGLAQVVYRTNAEWNDRIVLDTKYIRILTFSTDLKIIINTFFKVLRQENVYGELELKNKDRQVK